MREPNTIPVTTTPSDAVKKTLYQDITDSSGNLQTKYIPSLEKNVAPQLSGKEMFYGLNKKLNTGRATTDGVDSELKGTGRGDQAATKKLEDVKYDTGN